jgi:2-amino-4-hydroxy-6-hydroxymethyldihydropteridine diphosphokinase
MTEAVVALGSNLGDRAGTLRSARRQLARLGRVVAASSIYETAPVGGPEQGAFLNAVVVLETALDAPSLLAGLHEIEASHDREREVRWGPRTLDLDLIAHGDTVSEGEVVVPHPRATERRFVLEPLVEVLPDFVFPDGSPASECLASVLDQDLERTDEPWGLRVAICGPGRAGSALGAAAVAAGHSVTVVSRSGRDGGLGVGVSSWTDPIDADLILLTVPDRAITAVAQSVTWVGAPVVAHCSGITPVSVLAGLEGLEVGAFHPLAALTGPDAVDGAWVAVGGTEEAVEVLSAFARSIGALPFQLDDDARAAYHAAASIAANHVTTLLGLVEELAASAGVPFEAYERLVSGAVRSSFALGPAVALTGPVARGDEGTVAAQRAAVEQRVPDALDLFDALNEAARRLADRS